MSYYVHRRSNPYFGVKTLKRSMAEAMESRFDIFEHTDEYILATFLDPRFRVWFYRDNNTIAYAKNLICERVYENLSSIEETPINNSSNGGEIDSNQHTFAQAMQKICKRNQSSQKEHRKVLKVEINEIIEQYCNGQETNVCFKFWKEKESCGNKIWVQ